MIQAGKTLSFDVKVTGEPPPTKTFSFGGTELLAGDGTTIEPSDYRVKLQVTNFTRDQAGKYTLVAENPHGKDEATVDVTGRLLTKLSYNPLIAHLVHSALKYSP